MDNLCRLFISSNNVEKIDHFTLGLLKRSDALRRKNYFFGPSERRSQRTRVYALDYKWNLGPTEIVLWNKRSIHYKWFAIKYNSINTGTSENILWSNSSIQIRSITKDWITDYVIKTGPTENFSKIREVPV